MNFSLLAMSLTRSVSSCPNHNRADDSRGHYATICPISHHATRIPPNCRVEDAVGELRLEEDVRGAVGTCCWGRLSLPPHFLRRE
ncbi:hypothetical protein BDV96DRAFT_582774 [Lophiotrema nucula]|uniref:Uncharacterized protein n=1 Tax=Lophiotrema nucula TaxID=690887 RepID=A0A6A5YYR2_9PLEO|nr:hypothetical protein BDV96DRAFT_582774 [Lophiotrema nucula]